MKTSAAIFAVATLVLVAASPANAKGCLKGAVVGGVAGHYAGHHTVLGAIAGCAYGRHRANEQDRTRQGQRQAPAGEKLSLFIVVPAKAGTSTPRRHGLSPALCVPDAARHSKAMRS